MKDQYTTRDFYAAAYLVASGVELLSSTKQNGLTTFVFAQTQQVQRLVDNYYGLGALVNPVTYGNALRNLKSMIHANSDLENTYVQKSFTK